MFYHCPIILLPGLTCGHDKKCSRPHEKCSLVLPRLPKGTEVPTGHRIETSQTGEAIGTGVVLDRNSMLTVWGELILKSSVWSFSMVTEFTTYKTCHFCSLIRLPYLKKSHARIIRQNKEMFAHSLSPPSPGLLAVYSFPMDPWNKE